MPDRALLAQLRRELGHANAHARLLPPHWFFDERVAGFEREVVFRRSWQLVGPVLGELGEVGDFVTVSVAGVPVVLVRDLEGRLVGFVNVCRHRGHEVAQGCGNRRSFQCIYHGWTYRLDGSLRAVPRAEKEVGFDKSEFPLLPVAVGVWGPFVFVNLDSGARPFDTEFEQLRELARARGIDPEAVSDVREVTLEFACNWKVFIANSSEIYHIETVHPGISATHHVEPGRYVVELHDAFSYYRNPVRSEHADEGLADWETFVAWPVLNISGTPEGIVRLRTVTPLAADRCAVTMHFGRAPGVPPGDLDADIAAYEGVAGVQDREACESAQRGLAGQRGEGGPLLPSNELGVLDFQRRIEAAFATEPSMPTVSAR